jgi:hypothetical protein
MKWKSNNVINNWVKLIVKSEYKCNSVERNEINMTAMVFDVIDVFDVTDVFDVFDVIGVIDVFDVRRQLFVLKSAFTMISELFKGCQ